MEDVDEEAVPYVEGTLDEDEEDKEDDDENAAVEFDFLSIFFFDCLVDAEDLEFLLVTFFGSGSFIEIGANSVIVGPVSCGFITANIASASVNWVALGREAFAA